MSSQLGRSCTQTAVYKARGKPCRMVSQCAAMHRILLTATAVLWGIGNAEFVDAEETTCDEAVCAGHDRSASEEVQALRTELLQTAVQLKRSKEAELPNDMLHDLQLETFQAMSEHREALRRQADAMAAETRTAEALKAMNHETSTGPPQEQIAPSSPKPKHAKHHHHGGENKLLQEAMIPAGALAAGMLLLWYQLTTAGILAIYFGAQAGFTLYMKVVLSNSVISQELGIDGVPAGFLVTAVQQVVAFFVLAIIVAAMYCTPYRYTPRRLKSWSEVACVILFSFAFSLNIGLNNFSLSLLAVSLNMIIRSCLPIVTLAFQQILGPCIPDLAQKVRMTEVTLMVAGVVFAAVATLAKSEGSHHGGSESKNLLLGVFVCTLSDAACAVNLILGNMFGSSLDPPLNPVDTIFYMALPCALFLLPASILLMHPVEWPNFGDITDLQVFQKVMELSPTTMLWVILSGCIAAGYNSCCVCWQFQQGSHHHALHLHGSRDLARRRVERGHAAGDPREHRGFHWLQFVEVEREGREEGGERDTGKILEPVEAWSGSSETWTGSNFIALHWPFFRLPANDVALGQTAGETACSEGEVLRSWEEKDAVVARARARGAKAVAKVHAGRSEDRDHPGRQPDLLSPPAMASEPDAAGAREPGGCIMEGWLMKRSQQLLQWRWRYVKLTSDKRLVTFTSEQADVLTNDVDVGGSTAEATDFFLAAPVDFGFLVACREKTLRFAAETAATREEWLEKIASIADRRSLDPGQEADNPAFARTDSPSSSLFLQPIEEFVGEESPKNKSPDNGKGSKGPGRGKGPGKGGAKGAKGPGKAPPKGQGKGPPVPGKGVPRLRTMPKASSLPLGRRLSVRTLNADQVAAFAPERRLAPDGPVPGSSSDEEPSPLNPAAVDLEALRSAFAAQAKAPASARSSRRSPRGVHSTPIHVERKFFALLALAASLDQLQPGDCALSAEECERFTQVLPPVELLRPLADYEGDISGLRDVEREILPLARLTRLRERLRLLSLFKTLDERLGDGMQQMLGSIRNPMCAVQTACGEVRKNLLQIIVVLFNYVNYGQAPSENGKPSDLRARNVDVQSLTHLVETQSFGGPFAKFNMLHFCLQELLKQCPDLQTGVLL
eukprot:s1853_g7.t1